VIRKIKSGARKFRRNLDIRGKRQHRSREKMAHLERMREELTPFSSTIFNYEGDTIGDKLWANNKKRKRLRKAMDLQTRGRDAARRAALATAGVGAVGAGTYRIATHKKRMKDPEYRKKVKKARQTKVYAYSALDELFEFKEREGSKRAAITGAAQLYGGKRALNAGAERLVGAQRFVHGTSDESANKILKEGLKAKHGGADWGSSHGLGAEGGAGRKQASVYKQNSKGKVHVFKDKWSGRRLASGHAGLAQQKKGIKSFLGGMVGAGGGKKVYGEMDHGGFHSKFKPDTDYGKTQTLARQGKHDIKKLHKSRGGLRRIFKARSKDIPGYLRKNTGRALKGVGMLGVAGALGHRAYKNARKSYRNAKEKKR
jgi:hypothetical protein